MPSSNHPLCALLVLLCALAIPSPSSSAAAAAAAAAAATAPPPPSPSRIALLHMVNSVWFFQDLASITKRNKIRYATRHAYDFISHDSSGTTGLFSPSPCTAPSAVARGAAGACYTPREDFSLDARKPTFGKIKLALAACVGRDDFWLLWTDADALVFNQAKSLLDVVDDAYDIIVAEDWFMINAGVLLLRCSAWNVTFLQRIYDAREFDHARALDQSAIASFIEKDEAKGHVKRVPKWLVNVYAEEMVPGDFIVHFAGKLYEATPPGIAAIARQVDLLSRVDDVEKVASFFNTRYILGYYSGTCVMGDEREDPNRDCFPDDQRRLKLDAPLGSFSSPNRYRHLQYRNPLRHDWKDPNDVPGRADPEIRRFALTS